MTNPNNIVRVRARNGGRASVYEANGWAQAFSSGVLEGNGVIQNTSADMNVLVGGTTTKPDVLLAENPAGYKIALDVVGQQAIAVTAPASDSRISSIVAYTDDLALASSDTETTGSPSSCGLIVVNGDSAANPVAPDDATIRSAITDDGATGSQASYVVIANITVASSTTTITNSLIENQQATINNINIGEGKIKSHNIDFTTFPVETIRTTINVGGNNNNVTLSKIKIANNTYMIAGLVFGVATSVVSGSRVNVKLTLPSTLGITACLGGMAIVYQNSQAGSYTQYSRVTPADGSVDAYCMCADGINRQIWLNYIAIISTS